MGTINRFEDILAWQKSRELSNIIHSYTLKENFSKDFKLVSQIKASSGSAMDNIAEGFERGGNKEFVQFLSIAKGSCGEVRSQIHRAYDYKYVDDVLYNELLGMTIDLSKHISGFMTYLKGSDLKGPKFH
jgi:four helix bundle protein